MKRYVSCVSLFYFQKEVIVVTGKQRKFADEYLIDQNAAQAAIRAGYSEKSARSIGQRLLTKADIRAYIDAELEKMHNETIADAEEVLRYLTSVVRGESKSEIVVVESTGDGFSEAKNVEKAPDEKDKLKAAELLGKRYGLYSDKVNVSGAVPVAFIDNLEE